MPKQVNLDPFVFSLNGEGGDDKFGKQTVFCRCTGSLQLTQNGAHDFLLLNLAGSAVSPMTLIQNVNFERGYYLDAVTVKVFLQGMDQGGAQVLPGWSLRQDSPTTVDESGSITSSISISIDASGGTFGAEPTTSVGGGLTMGTSSTHTLSDFTFENHSDASTLQHLYLMEQTGDGTKYEGPSTLVNEFQSPFVGARLRPLPALAVSNVPVISQAVWLNDSADRLVPQAKLMMEFVGHFSLVSATNNFFTIDSEVSAFTETWRFIKNIDFTAVDRA